MLFESRIDFSRIAFLIDTRRDHHFVIRIRGHKRAQYADGFLRLASGNAFGKAAYRLQYIDRGVMIGLCEAAV